MVDVAVAEELAASTVAAVALPELEGTVVEAAGPEVQIEEREQAEQAFGWAWAEIVLTLSRDDTALIAGGWDMVTGSHQAQPLALRVQQKAG